MLRVFSVVIVLVSIGFLVVMTVGFLAPEEYNGELVESFGDRRVNVWNSITDVYKISHRKPEVENIKVSGDDWSIDTWTEAFGSNFRTYKVLEHNPQTRYRIELTESSYGLTGEWTYLLRETDTGTDVKIIERSFNKNILLRGIQTFIGRDYYIKKEMKSLRVSLFDELLETP